MRASRPLLSAVVLALAVGWSHPPSIPALAESNEDEAPGTGESVTWIVGEAPSAAAGAAIEASEVDASLGIGSALAFDADAVARLFPSCRVTPGTGGSEGEVWTVLDVSCGERHSATVHPGETRVVQFFDGALLGRLGPLLGGTLAQAADAMNGDEPWTCDPGHEEASGSVTCSPRDEQRLALVLVGQGATGDSTIPRREILRTWRVRSVAWTARSRTMSRPGPAPFEVLTEPAGPQRQRCSVRIDAGSPVRLGLIHTDEGGLPGQETSGIDVATIGVTFLPCPTPVFHVHWSDYVVGMGNSQSAFYMIVTADASARVLLSGSVPMSGHWGPQSWTGGEYSIECAHDLLTVRRSESLHDVSRARRPLFHPVEPDPREGIATDSRTHAAVIETRCRRDYSIVDGRALLVSAVLEYRSQAGDTLGDVVDGFGVAAEWIENPSAIGVPDRWITIAVPPEWASQRWRPLDPDAFP